MNIFVLRPLPEDTEVHSPKPTTSSSGKKGRSGTHKSAYKRVKDELWLGKLSFYTIILTIIFCMSSSMYSYLMHCFLTFCHLCK